MPRSWLYSLWQLIERLGYSSGLALPCGRNALTTLGNKQPPYHEAGKYGSSSTKIRNLACVCEVRKSMPVRHQYTRVPEGEHLVPRSVASD